MPSINVKLTEEELQRLKNCKKGSWKDYLFSSLWIKCCIKREPKSEWHKSWGKVSAEKCKPCHKTGFCPYGQVVEMFPLKMERTEFSCVTFGHDCPVFYCAEPIAEPISCLHELP